MHSEQTFYEEEFDSEEAIDLALAHWAARHSLPEARTEAIRSAILDQSRVFEMKPVWWRTLYGNLALSIQKANDVRGFLKFAPPGR